LNTARGLEFYPLSLLALCATPPLFVYFQSLTAPRGGTFRLPALLLTLGAVIAAPLVLELLAAFFYRRKPIPIRASLKAFAYALRSWISYNEQNSTAPGVLQSPVGTSRKRRLLVRSTLFLWAYALAPVLSYQLLLDEQYKNHTDDLRAERNQEEQREEALARWGSFEPPPEPPQTLKGFADPELELFPEVVELQPYQERLLQRMTPEQRKEFLEDRRHAAARDQVAAEEESAPIGSGFYGFLQDLWLGIAVPVSDDPFRDGVYDLPIGLVVAVPLYAMVIRELLLLLFVFMFPIAFFFSASARIVAMLRQQLEANPDDFLGSNNWDRVVEEVMGSDDPTEADSLILGRNHADGAPVIVPRKVFHDHAHILGDSGSGKTSMGISLILNQLIRHENSSIVVLDLKGDDNALFRGTQIDAEKANKPFRWFTNQLKRSTYAFNPLTQKYFQELSLYQKTDVITTALGLQYGTDYGRSYFSDSNADYLHRTFQAYPNVGSFHRLAGILATGYGVAITHDIRKDASHLVSISQRLAATEALNVTDNGDYPDEVIKNQIDFVDLFRTPQVVYMHLPASLGSASSAEIARIALYSLLGSASQTPEPERKQVFVFIDEFQRLLAGNLEMILQAARSMRIGLILANQSILDLTRGGVDLETAVRTNTRYKQVFAASNYRELEEMVKVSGEALIHSKSYGFDIGSIPGVGQAGLGRINLSETISPRLRVNDVLLATDAPDQSIVQVRRGEGYAQYGGFPFIMRSQFHISEDEYIARKGSPWPEVSEATLEGSEVSPSTVFSEFDEVDPLNDNAPKNPNPKADASAIDALLNPNTAARPPGKPKKRGKQ
jgi:hypothetical protein